MMRILLFPLFSFDPMLPPDPAFDLLGYLIWLYISTVLYVIGNGSEIQ